ncbi:MAG: multiprotein bridging factor aMBF1 [Desulfatiglandales bacterium]
MECELCGRDVENRLSMKIEGTVMEVCSGCARYGEKTKDKKTAPHAPSWQRPMRKTAGAPPKDFTTTELFDDYPTIIREARERKGLTQEKLGKLLNERVSVINRIESGKMRPAEKLIRKLEDTLNVKIAGKVESEKVSSQSTAKKDLTLGDIVEIKRK